MSPYRLIEMNDVFYPEGDKPKDCPQPKSGEAIAHELMAFQLPLLMNEVRRGVADVCWAKCNLPCGASKQFRRLTDEDENLRNTYSSSMISS